MLQLAVAVLILHLKINIKFYVNNYVKDINDFKQECLYETLTFLRLNLFQDGENPLHEPLAHQSGHN